MSKILFARKGPFRGHRAELGYYIANAFALSPGFTRHNGTKIPGSPRWQAVCMEAGTNAYARTAKDALAFALILANRKKAS